MTVEEVVARVDELRQVRALYDTILASLPTMDDPGGFSERAFEVVGEKLCEIVDDIEEEMKSLLSMDVMPLIEAAGEPEDE